MKQRVQLSQVQWLHSGITALAAFCLRYAATKQSVLIMELATAVMCMSQF
jgi:hypothetical protein